MSKPIRMSDEVVEKASGLVKALGSAGTERDVIEAVFLAYSEEWLSSLPVTQMLPASLQLLEETTS